MTAPSAAMIYPNLEQASDWTTQNTLANPEPDIDPNPPQDCFTVLTPNGRLFAAKAQPGKDGGWLSATKKLYVPGVANGQLDFDLAPGGVGASANTLEIDCIVCFAGYNYLFGFQILPQQGNSLQISNSGAGWQPAFPGPKSFDWKRPHHFTLNYAWDTAARSFTFVSVGIDGVNYPIPANQNPQTASNPNWDDCILVQVQQGVWSGSQAWWTETISGMTLRVW